VSEKVLVAYATKYGSTAEIAERIEETLIQAGLQVDVLPVKNVKDLEPYGAVVLGSAAYMFRWRSEAVSFLKKRKSLLSEMPVWLFSSGPLGKGDPVELLKGKRYPESLQPVIEAIQPEDVAEFHGVIDIKKLNFFEKIIFKKTEFQGDFRDWDMITSWAKAIADSLKK
jgi:menaquinone-dependent protoporphyrinogen oxidase